MKPETIVEESLLYQGDNLTFKLRQANLADGRPIERPVIYSAGAVAIVPLTDDREVRLIRQYRAAADEWIIELPAGGLNPGENPDEAAPRELLEETGDRAAHWHRLGGFYTTPDILDEFLHLYLATSLTPGPNQLEYDEHIEVVSTPWQEAIAMIGQGKIKDAKTIAGLMHAGLYLGLSFA